MCVLNLVAIVKELVLIYAFLEVLLFSANFEPFILT